MVARKRGVHLALPAERQGTNRLSRAGVLQLTLELQYAVLRSHDQATITAPPSAVAWTIALARQAQVSSPLDHSPEWCTNWQGINRGCISGSWHEGAGCEAEYPRDVGRCSGVRVAK